MLMGTGLDFLRQVDKLLVVVEGERIAVTCCLLGVVHKYYQSEKRWVLDSPLNAETGSRTGILLAHSCLLLDGLSVSPHFLCLLMPVSDHEP